MMYANWANDPDVTRWLRWEPHKNALETLGLLAAWATLYPNPDYYQWAIVEKGSGQVFGSIGIFNAALGDAGQKAFWPELDTSGGIWEAGYCIGRSWWNIMSASSGSRRRRKSRSVSSSCVPAWRMAHTSLFYKVCIG